MSKADSTYFYLRINFHTLQEEPLVPQERNLSYDGDALIKLLLEKKNNQIESQC